MQVLDLDKLNFQMISNAVSMLKFAFSKTIVGMNGKIACSEQIYTALVAYNGTQKP